MFHFRSTIVVPGGESQATPRDTGPCPIEEEHRPKPGRRRSDEEPDYLDYLRARTQPFADVAIIVVVAVLAAWAAFAYRTAGPAAHPPQAMRMEAPVKLGAPGAIGSDHCDEDESLDRDSGC